MLDQAPSLAYDSAQHVKAERVANQIHQLISREKKRSLLQKLGRLLQTNGPKWLSKIDIPDTAARNPKFGNPTVPKTWKGPWQSVTHPTAIAEIACRINTEQYH